MVRYTTSLLFMLLFAGTILAQSDKYNWGLGIHPSMYSFYALENGIVDFGQYQGGVQFSALRRVSASFDGGLEIGMGQVRHPDLENDVLQGKLSDNKQNFTEANAILRYKFDNGYILKKDALFSPFLKAGIGGNSYENLNNWSAFVPVGVGLNVRLNKIAAALTLQSGYNYGLNGRSYLHHSLGLNLNFGLRPIKEAVDSLSKDSDFDGTPDRFDVCPDVFGTRKTKGCPDADLDGLRDTEDRCPDQPGYANLMGCLDSDYDGIIDPDDQCPALYGDSLNGCPKPKPSDRDKDGVPDYKDTCPDQPGFFTAKGCPDNDLDGIRDENDRCPEEFGTPDFEGCPLKWEDMEKYRRGEIITKPGVGEKSGIMFGTPKSEIETVKPKKNPTPVAKAPSTIANPVDPTLPDDEFCKRVSLSDLGKAYFDTDISRPRTNAYSTLNYVVDVMKRCTEYSLRISGHADSDGPEGYNQKLSERRANSIRKYLTGKGIDAKRLIIQGYGESQPAVPNDTKANKKLNRRAEFEMNRGF